MESSKFLNIRDVTDAQNNIFRNSKCKNNIFKRSNLDFLNSRDVTDAQNYFK